MRALTAIALALALTACSEGRGNEGRTLQVQVAGETEETAAYRAVVAAYEKTHPDVDVNLIEVADKEDHLAKLVTAFAARRPPDVFLVNYREYSQFVARGFIEPIEGHIADVGLDVDDYYPQPIDAFTYDARLQCMPQNISSLVVYYNRRLFDAVGLEHPKSWTWEEFRSAAQALTRGDVKGLGIEPSIIRLAPFVWSNDGELVDDESAPTRFTFDDPASHAALEFVVSLVRAERVVPSEEEVAAQDLETRFVTGKLGMYLSSRKDTPVFREVQGLDWDVAPLPVSQQPAGILHSDGYCIARGSDLVSDAADFIAFAVGEQGQAITALAGRTVPALKSVAKSAAFLDPVRPPRHARVFLDGIPYIQRTPVIPTWPEIEDLAEEILTRVFYEAGYTIDDAIAALEQQTKPLFEEGQTAR